MEEGKHRRRNDYTEQLRMDDKQYRNVAEFCREYNLGYRTVVALLKKGHSGAEIVRTMLELPDIPKKSRGSRPVTYGGREYPDWRLLYNRWRLFPDPKGCLCGVPVVLPLCHVPHPAPS